MEKFKELINSSPLVLIDFFATWCGPCKAMHPVLDALKEQMRDTIHIYKVDIDKNETVAAVNHVRSVPTLMLFKDGQLVWRQSGTVSLAALSDIISSTR